jgi:hypothetical protein
VAVGDGAIVGVGVSSTITALIAGGFVAGAEEHAKTTNIKITSKYLKYIFITLFYSQLP